ncbi:MAG TPA: hypothetical protein PLL75_01285 [Candidatus Omnitrophota bacterium]|nr:hypothetical protein [Candidatus Omnitrophota bacterium]HPS36347.1 hypothetical protein [Candidatus Omnitrophota bacterium]
MLRKISTLLVLTTLLVSVSGVAYAAEADKGEKSLTRGAASLVLPGWGQYLNGEMETKGGKVKTGVMVLIEVGGIVTTILLGTLVGYPVIWVGIGILMFNHIWSAADAYAKAPTGPEVAMKGDKVGR